MKNIPVTLTLPERKDFLEASHDAERNAEIELWDITMGDGLDETNKY